jgi:dATP pyrophosphohydrolase
VTEYKLPVSVLVVIYTPQLKVLLMERADAPGYWQSVTGSQHIGESLRDTAIREVHEETGLDATRLDLSDWAIETRYEIYTRWRHRYAEGVTHNTEHVFGLCLREIRSITLSAREHLQYAWKPWQDAAEQCFSPSNAAAIRMLPTRL